MWFFPYTKTLVCFANSRKYGGWCVAGKEWRGGAPGEWVRPISLQPTHELMENDFLCDDGQPPGLLDLLEINFTSPQGCAYQKENHIIREGTPWKRIATLSWHDLAAWIDLPQTLWSLGESSLSGLHNRVVEGTSGGESLYLIAVEYLHLLVGSKNQARPETKRSVRGEFVYQGTRYRLDVTDPVIEQYVLGRQDDVYFIPDPVLCVSLSEPFLGYYYKLIAAVLTEKRFRK